MDKPENPDRLARREVEYQTISRRANRVQLRNMALGFVGVSIPTAVLLSLRDGFPWSSYVLGTTIGVAAFAAMLPVWRRFSPDSATPPSFLGLRRTRRREIRRAMSHGRALDDLALLPLVEEMARKMRRAFPFLVVFFGLCGAYIASALARGNNALPRWYTIPVLLGLVVAIGQQIYFLRRSDLVARLTRERLLGDGS